MTEEDNLSVMDPAGQSSTVDVLSNPRMVQNIRHAGGKYIMIQCNYGNLRITKESNLKGYRVVCFYKGAITNILYFIRIRWD